MPTLDERLRAILEPRYGLGPRIGAGGMALVFRAEDATLSRPVAVKVLRPELATAVGAERFLREARALASVAHPNVVAVHECGHSDGLHYYVMDFEEAPTLRACLEEGPCAESDAWRVGIDLLAALAAAHAKGVVHRDVKPANIFLRPDRAVLADFGVARDVSPSAEPLTEAESPGTPAYMAPEQATRGVTTVRSDLYAAGMVVYEAFTGRRWASFQSPDRADWSGVPRRARPVLARALDPDPERRWPDATSFRGALRRARRRRPTGLRVAVVALGLLAMLLLWVAWPKSPPRTTADLAVLPCRALPGAPDSIGVLAADYAYEELRLTRGFRTAEGDRVVHLADDPRRRPPENDWDAWSAQLGADWIAACAVTPAAGGWVVEATLHGSGGEHGPERRVVASDLEAGARLYDALIFLLGEAGVAQVTDDEAPRLSGYDPHAVRDYLNGKDAFRHDELKRAVDLFSSALRADPSFALAEWRLSEARRWLAHAAVATDLGELYERSAGELGPRDSMLLAARVAPYRDKPALLQATFDAYPNDAYVTLLFADELYHRGGLWDIPLDSAVALLRASVDRDPELAPAVEHLTQAYIRTGRKDAAKAMLEELRRVSGPPTQLDVYYPRIWGQAWDERWNPAQADAGFRELLAGFGDPGGPEGFNATVAFLELGARWVRYVDLPGGQVKLGEALVALVRGQGGREPQLATGWLAIALGQIGQGRIGAGLDALDSVAASVGTPEARLQAAEWRVLPWALELAGFVRTDAERGLRELGRIWSDGEAEPFLRARAALALAVGQVRLPEEERTAGWPDSLADLRVDRSILPAGGAGILLAGAAAARAGDADRALELTAPLTAYDSVALDAYPFGRALVYWLRQDWQAQAGDTARALATLYWHENTDLEEGTPAGLAQAAEVDAAFGVHARARTVELAGALRGTERVAGLSRCDLVGTRADDVTRLWAEPDPGIVPGRERVREIAERTERECAP
jgi:serine/threonine protein kinase/tetratricopeptide (TPR) repeat protein